MTDAAAKATGGETSAEESENDRLGSSFAYTARREPYLSVVLPLGFLVTVEGAVVAAVAAVKIANPWVGWGLVSAVLLLDLVLYVKLFGPLLTRHRVADGRLLLRYGVDVRATVPLALIEDGREVVEPLPVGPLTALAARFEADSGRVRMLFSDRGQLLLRLREPLPMRVGLRGAKPVREILLNVDEPERLLAAIGASGDGGVEAEGPGDDTGAGHQETRWEARPETTETGESAAPSGSPDRSVRQPPDRLDALDRGGSTSPAGGLDLAPGDRTTEDGPTGDRPAGERPWIEAVTLTRRFGDRTVVDSLALGIRRGEIYGLLGANGAGKTTTIRMLVGLLEPSAGSASIGGVDMWTDPDGAKTRLGYVPDQPLLYERLTAREMLLFLGRLRGLEPAVLGERIEGLIEELELERYADEVIKTFSLGTRKKVQLAAALLHRPEVLILDEPLSGLDPRVARRLKGLLIRAAKEDVAILLSTHRLDTAEELSDRVGILHDGRIVLEGPAAELRQQTASRDLEGVFLHITDPGRGAR